MSKCSNKQRIECFQSWVMKYIRKKLEQKKLQERNQVINQKQTDNE